MQAVRDRRVPTEAVVEAEQEQEQELHVEERLRADEGPPSNAYFKRINRVASM